MLRYSASDSESAGDVTPVLKPSPRPSPKGRGSLTVDFLLVPLFRLDGPVPDRDDGDVLVAGMGVPISRSGPREVAKAAAVAKILGQGEMWLLKIRKRACTNRLARKSGRGTCRPLLDGFFSR